MADELQTGQGVRRALGSDLLLSETQQSRLNELFISKTATVSDPAELTKMSRMRLWISRTSSCLQWSAT